MRWERRARAWLLAVLGAVVSGVAHASDYSNICRTADGIYEINDGDLARTDAPAKSIPFETVQEVVLTRKEGYCVARGKRYGFEGKTSVLFIRFKDNGQQVETQALCELAADGLPAAYNCEREVVTRDEKAAAAGAGAVSGPAGAWTHNDSLMRLDAAGAERRFLYEVPRQGMAAVGVKRGDEVFRGRREAQSYSGTAFIFTKACGRVGYPVTGTVLADERRVVLEGSVPLLGRDCKPRATKRDRLQFDFVGRKP